MAVPYTFGTATASIPLSNLDSNFATTITLGNTAIQLGNTVTTLNNMTLANVTVSSGSVTLTNITATTANVTTANISGTTTLTNLTASTALALDASKNIASVTNTGTGNNVLSASPTLTGTVAGASLSLSSLTSGRVPYATTAGLLTDSANLLYSGTDLTVYGLTVGRGAGTVASNTAVGASALAANTTGSNNTALGREALNANTTASSNTATGYQALYQTTTSGDNTGFGSQVLYSNTTGANNAAIGVLALGGVTTGSNNVAVGKNSGNDAVRIISTASNEGVFGNNSTAGLYVKVAWTVTSDIRDKTNIGAVPHGLDFVTRLNPIKYQYKVSREDDTPTGHVRYGFKAQELLELEGDNPVIINNDDPDNLKLTDQNLIAVLVNAIKELKAEFDAYKATHP